MKASELNDFLTFAIANNFPVLIKGRPGIGKSDIVAQAAKQANAKLIISHPVVSDPTDYKGLPFMGNDGSAHFAPFGELNDLITATEKTVFFLDDLGQAPASVQAACMQLILARRINGHAVSDQVTFIAATNRKEDRAGVSGILEPVKSRFASIVDLDVDVDGWVRWAMDNNMPAELIGYIRFRPEKLEAFEPTKDVTNSPCPRTIANIGKMQNAGVNKAIEFEVFKGAVGEKFAAEYVGFLKMFRKLPSIDEIILNPKGAPVPDEPSALCALSSAIAHRMTDQNIDALSTYLERLPAEIGVVSMQDATTKNRQLVYTKTFNKWSIKMGNLLN